MIFLPTALSCLCLATHTLEYDGLPVSACMHNLCIILTRFIDQSILQWAIVYGRGGDVAPVFVL